MLRAKAMVIAAIAFTLGAGLALPASGVAVADDHAGRVSVQDPQPAPDGRSAEKPKAGNSDAARLCAQGGYQTRFDAVTGSEFTTTGACVAHAAAGGTQATLVLTPTVYSCEATPSLNCWGVVGGSGLEPGSVVTIIGPEGRWQVATVDASGTLSAAAQIGCGYTAQDLFAARTYAPGGVTITTHPQIYSPCPSDG